MFIRILVCAVATNAACIAEKEAGDCRVESKCCEGLICLPFAPKKTGVCVTPETNPYPKYLAKYDKDSNGLITREEAVAVYRSQEGKTAWEPAEEDAMKMFFTHDLNSDGKLDLQELTDSFWVHAEPEAGRDEL